MKKHLSIGLVAVALAAGGWFMFASGPANGATQITVYKTPWCGCCKNWVSHLERSGFDVDVIEREDMDPIRQRMGVPGSLGSCHTASVGGYAVEGHVPAREIKRLLAEKPKAIGLAVPGMPIGSPGMEQGGQRDSYKVILFDDAGKRQVFARY